MKGSGESVGFNERSPTPGRRSSSCIRALAALMSLLGAVGCAGAATGSGVTAGPPAAASGPGPVSPADLEFMTGMIHHHAQALVMAAMTPTHGANASIQTLAERISVSQTDEIALVELWLTDNGQPVPEPSPTGTTMIMNGVEHEMLMPGMLTPAQIAELDAARGEEFDRLFLTYMIQHHRGAQAMVEELFARGGGTDDFVYKFASDTFADQGSEIDRMQRMLEAMGAPLQ